MTQPGERERRLESAWWRSHAPTRIIGGAADRSALGPIAKVTRAVGIDAEKLSSTAALDDAIAEFSRFYMERREQEIRSAGDDERKRQKLRDEFTPRL